MESKDLVPPTQIHCLACRILQPAEGVKLEITNFYSRKNRKPMVRRTWVGTCAGINPKSGVKCGKSVHQFAKGEEVPEGAAVEAPKDEAPKVEEAPKEAASIVPKVEEGVQKPVRARKLRKAKAIVQEAVKADIVSSK